MSTLDEVRANVYLQLDIDADDIAADLVDTYIQEGFNRTYALEYRWPFMETAWSGTLLAGATTFALPSAPSEPIFIESVLNDLTGNRLYQVPPSLAEENFSASTSTVDDPDLFSIWGGVVSLWPRPSSLERTYTFRGFRKPVWSGSGVGELDGDARLHLAITHYASSLCYAQFEDPELEMTYLQRWRPGVEDVRKNLMIPMHQRPLILNGGMTDLRRSSSNNLNWAP